MAALWIRWVCRGALFSYISIKLLYDSMSGVKISELEVLGSLSGDERIPVEGGVKITP